MLDFKQLSEGRGTACHSFIGALVDTEKAWTRTPMLARTSRQSAERTQQLFQQFEPAAVASHFTEMSNGSWTQQAITTGLDPLKIEAMSQIILRQVVAQTANSQVSVNPMSRLDALTVEVLNWIDGRHDSGVLKQINDLTGDQAPVRLTLVAPFAPGLAICGVVLRALKNQYPFFDADLVDKQTQRQR